MNSSQRKRKRRVWVWSGITLGIVLILIIGTAAVVESHGKAIPASRLATVKRGNIIKSVVATGPVHPITQVEVKSKASGIVEKLYVDTNEHVVKGQKLAQLDQQEILAQVAAQKADLAGAEANVTTAKANVAEDRVNAAAPDLPMYRQTWQRNKTMLQEGLVSQQTYDNAERDYMAALNKRNVARAQISVDEAKLKQSEAQVQQAKASLAQLQEQLSYTTLVSPIDGVVLSRDVQVGDAVSSILVLGSTATKVMTIGNIDKVYVKGKVDEADIGSVYLGQPAVIHIESFPNKIFHGNVTKIAPMGVDKDNVTTFEVRVSIENPGHEIKAAMTANAEIQVAEHKNTLIVPEQALFYDNTKQAYVDVPDAHSKNGMRKVPVTVGISNGSQAEILSGLKEGQTVVLQQ
ncbi:MAG: efflux RND transporter periplasmic adaptor subunit [Acidobacteria bacterium]|nr:efflux RND transporter periplasmic adaptor subunit [Acidobacteriota bacterium]